MPSPQPANSPPITLEQLAARIDALERHLARATPNGVSPAWWEAQAGRFKNDPEFDEIVRLGRQERRKENAQARKWKRKQLARP